MSAISAVFTRRSTRRSPSRELVAVVDRGREHARARRRGDWAPRRGRLPRDARQGRCRERRDAHAAASSRSRAPSSPPAPHVLVEKPITETPEQARELIALAARTRRVLQVGHLERFNAAVLAPSGTLQHAAFHGIASPRAVQGARHRRERRARPDDPRHRPDAVRSPARRSSRIDAIGTPVFSGEIDIANARIRFANGCVANTTASRVSMKTERKLRHLPGRRLHLHRPAAEDSHDRAQARRVRRSRAGARSRIEERSYEQGDALKREIEAFLDASARAGRPSCQGEDGLRALETAIRITELVQADQTAR